MNRIMVIGGPGSGKSTLARALGERTGLPVYHMDHLHYRSGWEPVPLAEKAAMAREIEDRARWIFEGGLSATYDHRLARAEMLVHLDLPLTLRLWRLMKRIYRYRGTVRPDMADGCPEAFHWDFMWWVISTARKNTRRDRELTTLRPDLPFVRLRSQSQIDRWRDSFDGVAA